jgi:hypothetical protein
MSRIATPQRIVTPPRRVCFCALDGPVRVIIEADSEDDARYLCREMRWEFIGLCDG